LPGACYALVLAKKKWAWLIGIAFILWSLSEVYFGGKRFWVSALFGNYIFVIIPF